MDEERVGAGGDHRVGQRVERDLGVLLVDAEAALDRDRHRRPRAFIAATQSPTSRRLAHQAGAERAGLHPVGRAADIEVDLVVAEIGADPRRRGELRRLRPAELERDADAPRRAKPSRRSRSPWITASATTISV